MVHIHTILRIIHERFGVIKVCANYLSSSKGHKIERVRCAKHMFAKFEPQTPIRLTDIVTGDEIFVQFYVAYHQNKEIWGNVQGGGRKFPVILYSLCMLLSQI